MNYYFLLLLFLGAYLAKEPQLPNHVVPLYGNISLGYYYANVFVGSPPQQQSVILGTGSGQLAFPSSKCQDCSKSHLQPPFQLSQSKTSKILTCGSGQQVFKKGCNINNQDSQPCIFSISYAEGSSLSGIIIQDQIQFEKDSNDEAIKTTFGCTTKQTKLFYTQAANEIFGLAPERQSKLLQKLYSKHSPKTGEQLLFSLCLAKNGGQFVIGKLRPQIHRNKESVKTRFVTTKNLYTLLGIGEIRMGDRVIKEVNENSGYFGVFIDSGSTLSYLPRQNFLKLSGALQKACVDQPQKCQRSKLNSNCFKLKPEENSTIHQTVLQIFPPIELQMITFTCVIQRIKKLVLVFSLQIDSYQAVTG